MKLKIFQLSAFVNLISVVAFTGFVVYFVMSGLGRVSNDWGLFITLIIACIAVFRDLIALHYVRICDNNLFYTPGYKILYVISGVILVLTAGAISWAFYLAWKEHNSFRINSHNIIPIVATISFVISTFILTILDFYVYSALEKRKDPSNGLLEELKENHDWN